MVKTAKNKDLAKKLGVSSTLVSLVLNNKGDQYGIKRDTQEKVFFLARKMGFFDNDTEKEKNPVESQPGIIGMIVPALNDSFVTEITPLFQKIFADIGIGFSIISKDPDDVRYDRMVGAFRKFFSGLILVGDAADDQTIRSLRTVDYPFVVLDKVISVGRLNTINSDIDFGAELVAKHIVSLGYKNILIASTARTCKRELSSILAAFLKFPEQKKPIVIDLKDNIIDNSLDFGQIEQFFRPPYRTDVVITMESDTIYSIIPFINGLKLRIPNDIALFSMNDGYGFELISPSISCLKKPLSAMAAKTANMLWSEIKNSGKGKYVRQINLNPELVVRNSCGSFK